MSVSIPKIKIKNLPAVLLLCVCTMLIPILYGEVHPVYLCMIGINSFLTFYYMLYDSSRSFTLAKLINFFILIFFILANAIQYANNSVVLTFPYSFDAADYILFQFLNFCIIIAYNGLHDYIMNMTNKEPIPGGYKIPSFSFPKMAVISCIASLLVLQHNDFNIFSLLFRGLTRSMMADFEVGAQEESSTAGGLIFGKVIRSIPWAVYIISCGIKTPRKYSILFFTLTLFTVFPAGISRNAAAMYWIPIMLMTCEKYLRGNRFIYVMLIGIFLVFPFLNNFRHFSGNIEFKLSFDYLDSMDMDASQIFMATMSAGVITSGTQLLGALLFFVPRSIWLTKPVGSGCFLVTEMGGDFTNVSMPFFAEGYINFGFIGILVFILIMSYITGVLDRNFWTDHIRGFKPNDGFYMIVLGSIIFIMRGDLMSSFAYTVGISISYFLTLRLSQKSRMGVQHCKKS